MAGNILRDEFGAEDGSFLIQLRIDLFWDKEAFQRLIAAMQECCMEHENSELLERWMADGFWYLQSFVRDWTSHPSFPRPYDPDYYEKAYSRLDDLASWFFTGSSPYLEGHGFEPIE